jgi:hypothetical protein
MLGSEFEICFGRSILCVLLFYGPRLIAGRPAYPDSLFALYTFAPGYR